MKAKRLPSYTTQVPLRDNLDRRPGFGTRAVGPRMAGLLAAEKNQAPGRRYSAAIALAALAFTYLTDRIFLSGKLVSLIENGVRQLCIAFGV